MVLQKKFNKNKLISHRGNLVGPSKNENDPEYILESLNHCDFTEVDIWLKDQTIYLGHDEPQYIVEHKFVDNNRLIFHAKNLTAFEYCLHNNFHCFWHDTDDYTLTSQNYIWTYPGKQVSVQYKSIIVDNSPDWRRKNYNCYAVCTDHVK